MTIKNGDLPAMPITNEQAAAAGMQGLTKHEMFCLHMGVAETGDAELDEVIRKGNRQKTVVSILQSMLSAPIGKFTHSSAQEALQDALTTADMLTAVQKLGDD